MRDVYVIPRCMMSTRQWSRPETNVCWETTSLRKSVAPERGQGQVSLSVGA